MCFRLCFISVRFQLFASRWLFPGHRLSPLASLLTVTGRFQLFASRWLFPAHRLSPPASTTWVMLTPPPQRHHSTFLTAAHQRYFGCMKRLLLT